MNTAVGAGGAGGGGGIHAFGAMSGGTSRYNTGSHVDVDGTSLLLGVAKQVAMNAGGAGNLTLGAFFEGGWGNYDSYNDFDSGEVRSEEHTSELQSLMRISYAVFCLKKKNI